MQLFDEKIQNLSRFAKDNPPQPKPWGTTYMIRGKMMSYLTLMTLKSFNDVIITNTGQKVNKIYHFFHKRKNRTLFFNNCYFFSVFHIFHHQKG
jgi:hypothetical protein